MVSDTGRLRIRYAPFVDILFQQASQFLFTPENCAREGGALGVLSFLLIAADRLTASSKSDRSSEPARLGNLYVRPPLSLSALLGNQGEQIGARIATSV
jgi:hypothetical protein